MKIKCGSRKAETQIDVKLTTNGFTLTTNQARIEWSEDVVKIYPIPD